MTQSQLKQITVINNNVLRGLLAPAGVLSSKKLQDMVDLLELSDPDEIKETTQRIKDANKNDSWIPLANVRKQAEEAD